MSHRENNCVFYMTAMNRDMAGYAQAVAQSTHTVAEGEVVVTVNRGKMHHVMPEWIHRLVLKSAERRVAELTAPGSALNLEDAELYHNFARYADGRYAEYYSFGRIDHANTYVFAPEAHLLLASLVGARYGTIRIRCAMHLGRVVITEVWVK